MPSRREFLRRVAGGTGTLALAGMRIADARPAPATPLATKSLHVLVLGGTGFIGPAFVQAALQRGHTVSVFNRGNNRAGLPQGVEQLIGDRNGDLKSLMTRDWDAVFDLATYVPNWVRTLGESLKGRVGHYTFISTISVYESPYGADENSKVVPYTDPVDPYTLTSQGSQYGPLKSVCELEARKQFSDKTLTLRPGHIIGPREKAGAFTYLPARMAQGGEILAAGSPLDPVQMIDVRDLAEWAVRLAEQCETGTYNVTGPDLAMGWAEMLGAIRGIFSVPLTLTWIPMSWLTERKVSPFSPPLFWPSEVGLPGLNRVKIDRARAKGLTFRPLSTTAADTLAWYENQPTHRQPEALIGFSGPAKLQATIEHERDLLSQWHAERGP